MKQVRPEPEYFRVGFYGKGFPSSVRVSIPVSDLGGCVCVGGGGGEEGGSERETRLKYTLESRWSHVFFVLYVTGSLSSLGYWKDGKRNCKHFCSCFLFDFLEKRVTGTYKISSAYHLYGNFRGENFPKNWYFLFLYPYFALFSKD